MINSSLQLSQRAKLTEKILSKSLSSGKPTEVALQYEQALTSLVGDRPDTQESRLFHSLQRCLEKSKASYVQTHDRNETTSSKIASSAYQELLTHWAQGGGQSVQAGLAAIMLGAAHKVADEVPSVTSGLAIQSALLKETKDHLVLTGDEQARYLFQMGDSVLDRLERQVFADSDQKVTRRNQVCMDTLGIIATLE